MLEKLIELHCEKDLLVFLHNIVDDCIDEFEDRLVAVQNVAIFAYESQLL